MRHENLEGGAPAPPIEDRPVSHELALPVADLTATLTATEPANAMASSSASPAPDAETTARAAISVDLNELQVLTPEQFEERCRDFDLRMHPGRTRHHHILDLVRDLLGCGARSRRKVFSICKTSRSRACAGRALIFFRCRKTWGCRARSCRHFHLRPGQRVAGTLRLAARSRKITDAR